jgi:glutathione S-transferase
MALTIFGTSKSRAFRVLWAAKELQLDFSHEPIDWQTCGQDPAYLAVNPAGSIPCIREGDFVLAESLAINLYLARKHGRLWPETHESQGLATQWSFWAATSLEPAYVKWAMHARWLPLELRQPAVAEEGKRELVRPMNRLNAALQGKTWLLEDRFTIADLNVASVISLLRGEQATPWPDVSAWLNRCAGRQASKEAARLP